MLSTATRALIDGQCADVDFESRCDIGVSECAAMAAGKTGALLDGSCALGALFEAVQLAIMVHDDGEHATITIKLPADQLPKITHVAEGITDVTPSHEIPRGAAPELVGMLSVPPVRFELTLDGF